MSRGEEQAEALHTLQITVDRLDAEVNTLKSATERNDSAIVSEAETIVREVYDTAHPESPLSERVTTYKGKRVEHSSHTLSAREQSSENRVHSAAAVNGEAEAHITTGTETGTEISQHDESHRRTLPWWTIVMIIVVLALLLNPVINKGLSLIKRFLKTD